MTKKKDLEITALDREFKEALRLRDNGRIKEAIGKLNSIKRKCSNKMNFFLVLANMYWDSENLNKAIFYFRKSTVIKPSSEMASQGLFHALLEKGLKREAFDEMKRYFLKYPIKRYKSIIRGIMEDYLEMILLKKAGDVQCAGKKRYKKKKWKKMKMPKAR